MVCSAGHEVNRVVDAGDSAPLLDLHHPLFEKALPPSLLLPASAKLHAAAVNSAFGCLNSQTAYYPNAQKANGQVQIFPSWLDLWLHFQHPFQGKCTPEQVQLAIQLLYRFHKTSDAFKDVNAFVQKPFLGLACNGFVGNYIQNGQRNGNPWWKASNLEHPGPNTYIEGLLRLQANKILSSMDEIKPSGREIYILAFCTPMGQVIDRLKSVDANGEEVETIGHIMITEPGTVRANGQELEVTVVESTGGKGLVDSTYKIKSVIPAKDRPKEGVFKVIPWIEWVQYGC
jgi:hypothetical protein